MNRPLMVVLEGEIEILSERDTVVTVHRPGNFSGDVDVIAGHPAVVRARARSAGRVLEVPAPRVRSLVVTDPELSQIFLRAFILRRTLLMSRSAGSIVLIGSRHSAGTLTLQEFLTRNNQPYTYLDADQDAGVQATLEGFGMGVDDVPVLICSGSQVLKKPTIEEVADCLGLSRLSRDVVRDLVVIGAGPAGLAAAVYGASEGLDVLVLEATAPGGQAGSSSRIENYLGFPTGVSGQDLANSALLQAQKFGAELVVARTAAALRCDRRPYRIGLGPGVDVAARTVVIATGAHYRKPDIPEPRAFRGRRRLLRRHAGRGDPLPGRGRRRGRRGELRRPGRDLSFGRQAARHHADPGTGTLRHDVALPDPADRGDAQHRAQDADAARRPRRREQPGARDVARTRRARSPRSPCATSS